MRSIKIEDIRFSSSSIDEFFRPGPRVAHNSGSPDANIKEKLIGKIRISDLNQLAGFEFVSDDQLIRLSKQDFWKLGNDNDGPYIERLVDDTDGPIHE